MDGMVSLVGQSLHDDIEESRRGEGVSTSAPRESEMEQTLEEHQSVD